MTDQTTERFQGTPVVPGAAYGPVLRPGPKPQPNEPHTITEEGRAAEAERLREATEAVAARLLQRVDRATGAASEVLSATAGLARDKGLLAAATKHTRRGTDAETAISRAIEAFAGIFKAQGGIMAERVTDLYDIRDRVIAELQGVPEPGIPSPSVPSVLLAEDLAPADTAGLDPSRIIALATSLGGPTSHTAIIARQLGIPCVVAVRGLDAVPEGTQVLVDGGSGVITTNPDETEAEAAVAAARKIATAAARYQGPCSTTDGRSVKLYANVQAAPDAREALSAGAEGVGLYRTELSFLSAETEPSVEDQCEVYTRVLDVFPDKTVTVRTLDAGSDKPVAFASLPDEDNPALGVRGARIAFSRPEIFENQVEAIAKASAATGADVQVMAPMIATAEEARFAATRIRAAGLKAGVMVEIPAAALMIDRILAEVDFVSIGTNDLAQYVMAADRLSPELASLNDPWHPALLMLIERVATAGQASGKPVGVCGEAAADPLLACVLVGLGVTSLSCAAAALRAVGASVSQVSMPQCEAAAKAALKAADAQAARKAARKALGR